MKIAFIIVLALACWKTVMLSLHHIDDDNTLAFIGDMFSILAFIVTGALMWFFF